jgi:hypothetical protein
VANDENLSYLRRSPQLLQGPPAKLGNGGEALKLSILELVGRGWLGVRESPETLRSQPDLRFIRAKRAGVPEDRPLFAAFRLFDEGFPGNWAPDDGLPGFALWKGLEERYGDTGGYAQMEVLPSLRARDLYERTGSGLIGTLLRGGWRRAQSGNRLRCSFGILFPKPTRVFLPGSEKILGRR